MINRFQNCKSLEGLRALVNKIPFTELSAEEAERIVVVFNAVLCVEGTVDEVEMPLTEAGYSYIRGKLKKAVKSYKLTSAAKAAKFASNNSVSAESAVDVDVATTLETADSSTVNNNKEDFIMSNNQNTNATANEGFFKSILDAAAASMAAAKTNVKVKVGEDAEEFKSKADDSITTCKDALMSVIGKLDQLTGATALKRSLLTVLYTETEGSKSPRAYLDAAAKCRAIIYDYIECIMEFGTEEQDLKTIAALRYMLAEDEDGNPTGRRSIFTAFANVVVWVCRKVSRTFKRWFGTDASTNIFGSVGASLASIFGVAAGVLGSALKVALHTLVFVGSYIVTAVIKAVAFVWEQLKKIGGFVKSKITKKDAADDAADDEVLQTENC